MCECTRSTSGGANLAALPFNKSPSKEMRSDGKVRAQVMQRASASRRSYTRAIFRTHAHLADEAAGILVAGGAIGCAVAGMKLPRAREQKTVALEAYFDKVSADELSRIRVA